MNSLKDIATIVLDNATADVATLTRCVIRIYSDSDCPRRRRLTVVSDRLLLLGMAINVTLLMRGPEVCLSGCGLHGEKAEDHEIVSVTRAFTAWQLLFKAFNNVLQDRPEDSDAIWGMLYRQCAIELEQVRKSMERLGDPATPWIMAGHLGTRMH